MSSKDSTDEEIIDILLPVEDLRRENRCELLRAEIERLQRMLAVESRGGALLIAEWKRQDKRIDRLRALIDKHGDECRECPGYRSMNEGSVTEDRADPVRLG